MKNIWDPEQHITQGPLAMSSSTEHPRCIHKMRLSFKTTMSTLNTQHSTGGNNKYFYIHWQPSHRLTLSLSDWSKGLWPLWPVGSLVEIKRLQTSEYKSWSISPDEKDLDVIYYIICICLILLWSVKFSFSL